MEIARLSYLQHSLNWTHVLRGTQASESRRHTPAPTSRGEEHHGRSWQMGGSCLWICVLSHFGCVQLSVAPRSVAQQAPLSMGFLPQESWSVLLFPPPGGSSRPRDRTLASCVSGTARQILYHWAPWEALDMRIGKHSWVGISGRVRALELIWYFHRDSAWEHSALSHMKMLRNLKIQPRTKGCLIFFLGMLNSGGQICLCVVGMLEVLT